MLALLALAAGVQGQGHDPAPAVVGVAEVKAHIDEWNGRIVEVDGWVTGCLGRRHLSWWVCGLDESSSGNSGVFLSLGAGRPRNDPLRLRRYDGRQVVIRGKVTNQCAHPDDICLDGGLDLMPLAVVRVVKNGR